MTADIVAIAEAIKDDLNADPKTNFGREFEAQRTNGDFEYELKAAEFRVDVVPAAHPQSPPMDRGGSVDHHCSVQIAVREGLKKRGQGEFDNEKLDPLRSILQKIQRFFIQRELTNFPTAHAVSSEYEADGAVNMLRQFSTYLGIVRVTYAVRG